MTWYRRQGCHFAGDRAGVGIAVDYALYVLSVLYQRTQAGVPLKQAYFLLQPKAMRQLQRQRSPSLRSCLW